MLFCCMLVQYTGNQIGDDVSLLCRTGIPHERQGAHLPATRLGGQRISSGHHQTTQSAVYLGGTALLHKILRLQRLLRQRGQRVAQARNGGLNIHRAAQAELRGGADDTGLIGEKRPRDDIDVAALPLYGLCEDLTVLQGNNRRIECNISTGRIRAALDRGIELTVDEPDRIGGLNDYIAAAGLVGFRRDRRVVTEELSACIDGDVARIPLSRTPSRQICAAAHGNCLVGVERDVPTSTGRRGAAVDLRGLIRSDGVCLDGNVSGRNCSRRVSLNGSIGQAYLVRDHADRGRDECLSSSCHRSRELNIVE